MASRLRFLRSEAAILLLYIVLTAAMTYPLILHLEDHVAGDRVDPLYTIWVMDWELDSARRGFSGFYDAPVFHPHRGTLAYADYLPGLTLLAAPLMAIQNNWVWAYNILFLASYVLCAWGMFRLVVYLTGGRTAAFLSGLIFAFFTYRLAHISHLELLTMGWMPLVFLYLIKLTDQPSARNAFGLGLFFVLQTWTCAYYGVYLAFFAALAWAYLAWKTKAYAAGAFWKRQAALAAGGLPFLVLFYLPYLIVHEKMQFSRMFDEVVRYSAQIQHLLSVPPWTSFWGWALHSQPSPEWMRYPGFVAVLLAAVGIVLYLKTYGREIRREEKTGFLLWDVSMILALCAWLQIDADAVGLGSVLRRAGLAALGLSLGGRMVLAWKSRRSSEAALPLRSLAARFFIAMFGVSFVLALGPQVMLNGKTLAVGPYKLLYDVFPAFQGLRAPNRLLALTMLSVAVLAGLAVARGMAKIRSAGGRATVGGLLAVLIMADYAAVPIRLAEVPIGSKIPPIYRAVRDLPDACALIEFPQPMTHRENIRNALLMYYSTFHGKPLFNGYSGYFPPGHRAVRQVLESFPSDKTLQLLRDIDIGCLVVHTGSYRAETAAGILEGLLARPADVELLAAAEGDYLFRILPAPKPPPPPDGPVIPASPYWTVLTGSNPHLAGAALDGKTSTLWTSAGAQVPGEFIQVDFDRALTLSRIELWQGTAPLDFPRSFVVEGSADGETWEEWRRETEGMPDLKADTIEEFLDYRVILTLPARTARHLRIRLTAPYGREHWSIGEIVLKR